MLNGCGLDRVFVILFSFSERYFEYVNPIITYAQKRIVARIVESGGSPSKQAHFDSALTGDKERKFHLRDYVKLQLKVMFNKSTMKETPTGSHFIVK